MFSVGLVLVSLGAGTIGSMLGLGGGVLLIPVLTIFFGIPLRSAIAASAVSVVANSVSGSQIYLQQRYTNLRLAFILLVATSSGALVGSLLAVSIPEPLLQATFATLLVGIGVVMIFRQIPRPVSIPTALSQSDPYRLGGRYLDGPMGEIVRYVPTRLGAGIPLISLAGVVSGLFGIGGGPITVPVMNLIMRLPLKAAASTSGFMVGFTAATSALVYYNAGHMDPSIVIPALLGIVLGAQLGIRIATRLRPNWFAIIYIITMLVLATLMYLQAFGIV